ncbi:unnamed protein product [Absidia cylindrospora]
MIRRRQFCLLYTFIILTLSTLLVFYHDPDIITNIGYYTRPIWDKDTLNFDYQRHYYADGVPMKTLCELNGWTFDNNTAEQQQRPKVYNSVIFSVELDMLEIRLAELWDVVDMFIIWNPTRRLPAPPSL